MKTATVRLAALLCAIVLGASCGAQALRAQDFGALGAGDGPFFQGLNQIRNQAMQVAKNIRQSSAAPFLLAYGNSAGTLAPAQSISLHVSPGEIDVDCSFDGHARTCLLDTGAGNYILVEDDAFFGRYRASGASHISGVSNARTSVDAIRIARLKVGPVDAGPVDAIRRKSSCGAMPNPILGPQAIIRKTVAFNFSFKQMILNAPAPSGTLYPLSLDKVRHFLFSVDAGGGPVSGVFDTGASMTLVDRAYVAAHRQNFIFESISATIDASCKAVPLGLYRARSITLGGATFNQVDVMVMDLSSLQKNGQGPRIIVGDNIITRADWYFDLAKGRWTIKKINTSPAVALAPAGPSADSALADFEFFR